MMMKASVQRRTGFTLIELLVVVAIIGLLIGLLVPALASARDAGSDLRTLSNMRQLLIGYSTYTVDHDGHLLPGQLNNELTMDMRLSDGYGGFIEITDSGAPRLQLRNYPWRLASSLDVGLGEILLEGARAEEFLTREKLSGDPGVDGSRRPEAAGVPGQWHYFISLSPSFGLNTFFLGGVYAKSDFLSQVPAFVSPFHSTFRPAIRLSEVGRPSSILTFATARDLIFDQNALPEIVEGHHQVDAPVWNMSRSNDSGPGVWSSDRFTPDDDTSVEDYGNLSPRLSQGRAGVVYADGHASPEEVESLRDMRMWAPSASSAGWEPPSPF